MATESASRRTPPSTTCVTFSSRPICATSLRLALKRIAVVRAITPSCPEVVAASSVVTSSVIASLKYSCSESPVRLRNGSTTILSGLPEAAAPAPGTVASTRAMKR